MNNGGYVVIYDHFNKSNSFEIKDYKHEKKLKVYRWDYKKAFLSLPYYQKKDIIKRFDLNMKDFVEISLIKKNLF